MATLTAKTSFNISALNISSSLSATDFGVDNNVFASFNGVTYEDVAWVEFGFGDAYTVYGGEGIVYNGSAVTGGVVTGVLEEHLAGSSYVIDWAVQGIRVSAVSIWNAAMTAGTTDDRNLVASALAGADTIRLSNGADRMQGFGGNDKLFGNGGNDALYGDAGADVVTGGLGRDIIYGGAGADVFDYNFASESTVATTGRDVIGDFVRGTDRIDLSGIDANTDTAANDTFRARFVAATAEFTAAGQLKFSDGVLYGNTDADAQAEFAIALTGITALSSADLVL